jgi:preprotein translocase subunit SecE
VKRIRRFLAEAVSELRKVSWPTWIQVRNLTVLVFAVSFVIGAFITVVDTIFIGIRNLLVSLPV